MKKLATQLFFALVVGMLFSVVTGYNPLLFTGGIVAIQQVARFIPMPAGLMFFNFTDLEWNDSLENMGGLTSIGYFAPIQDIETFPTLSSNPVTDDDLVMLTGNFAMKEGKSFIQVYMTPEMASLKASNQGETDGQSFKIEGEFFYPGTKSDCRAFARKANNTRGILIMIDPDGDRIVVGTDKFPCYFKPTVDWGKAAADRKGMTVAYYQNHFAPGLEYHGTIPLSETTIPAIS